MPGSGIYCSYVLFSLIDREKVLSIANGGPPLALNSLFNGYFRHIKMLVDHKIGTVVRLEDPKTGSLPSVTREYLLVNTNPPRLPKTIVKAFIPKDSEDILRVCEGEKYTAIRNRALVLMFLDTGLRLADMTGIQTKDVNIEAGIIKVMGKGSWELVVVLGTATH